QVAFAFGWAWFQVVDYFPRRKNLCHGCTSKIFGRSGRESYTCEIKAWVGQKIKTLGLWLG
ncbi:MAG: hypothetical protein LBS62_03345, partial [Clostridiales bacterium]|nr:hypothetical protein [Clostridiales bacterium]